MGSGKVGSLWRAKTHRRRIGFVAVFGLLAVVGAMAFPFAAQSHDASDFFIFSKATHGPFAENPCVSDTRFQAEFSGSTNDVDGRIHSNADISISGQTNDF